MTPAPDEPPVGPELERRLRDAYARATAARGEPSPPDDDPSPEALHEALAGRLPDAERARVLDRAMRTERGRREVALLRVALGASAEAWPELQRGRSWWLRPGVAAAAAAVLATAMGGGAWWQMMHSSPNTPPGADPVRAGAPAARVTLHTPDVEAGAGAPAALAWGAVADAVRYDVEVVRGDGTVAWSATTRDTTLALPAAALPPAGEAYEWWVRARTLGGESRRSALGRVRVR